jgi:hypothetical protein
MSNLTINSVIDTIYTTQQVTERFSKREFVLRIPDREPQYDQLVKFELHGDKVDVIDVYNSGDKVTVTFNLRGRKHTGQNGINYFNTLQAWKIQKQN